MEVVRRAYELWEKAGKPEGRDQALYHQAERDLEGESEGPETPEGRFRPSTLTAASIAMTASRFSSNVSQRA
jgi:Protein of unknown function (DUF2934)